MDLERFFKTGGIEQRTTIDDIIFVAQSVDMLELFLRFGVNLHTPGPPGHPTPYHLIHQVILEKIIEKSE